MLKLRSIFVTSLLTGLVVTSNFGCGGSSNPNPDTNKTDAKDALDVNKDMGGTGGSAVEVKPETVDASDAKDAVDTADTGDVAKDSVDVAETGDVAKDAVDATDGSEAGETLPPVCNTPICVLTNKRCGPGGGMQTCVIATSGANVGCPDWSAETACGAHQTCGAGVCTCNTAPAGCTAAGTFCDANGAKATCAADAQGCFFISVAAAACPTNQSCTGTLPAASCTCNNTNCTAAGLTCADSHTVRTCSADGSALHCLVAADSSCGAIKTCTGGACACPMSNGTHENEGCNRATNADICDGPHILTCVRDTDSGCDIWKVAPGGLCESDNGGGLTCGTKGGPAACQCPPRTGGDVFTDPVAGTSDTGGVFATGVTTPAQCRLPTLTKALGLAAVTTNGINRVIAISAAAAVFNSELTFPLTVPAGVLLTTADATPTPANYTINFNSSNASNAVFLANGSTIKGFTIQNVNGSASADAISALPSATVTIDTVTINAKGTGSTLAQGVLVNSAASATLTGVTIENAAAAALEVNTSGTVTISKGSLTASQTGLHVQLGAVTATDASVTNNVVGIQLDTGTAPSIHLVGGTVAGNGFGVVVAKGTLLSDTGTMVQNSISSGIVISGGSASLHGIQITANGANGLISSGTGTTVTIDAASAINGNGKVAGDGIVSGTGSLLTISGATEISANTGNGITLLGGLTSISGVNIHNNLANGVDIRSNGSVINIGAANPATTLINNNSLNGVLVEAAPKTASDANSVTLEGVTASTNGKSGIYVAGTTGNASVTIKGSIVSSNGDTGVLVEEAGANKTTTVFQSNDVFGNKTTSNAHSVGGILFNTSSTLPTFVGNKVHSNVGDELGFNAIPDAPAVKWIISPPSAACDATANSLYCHGDGNVGLRVIGGALVDAEWVHWSNLPPAGNVDYSPFIAPPAPAQVDVSNACAVAACP